ncbi:tRNA pseudouridine synthase 1 [Aspergillus brasiliensis]|nr:tRNA pseudouridine synthase 1 [Aspergillus brasiliensis]
MPVHVVLRRSLAPHLASFGARIPLRNPQARFYSPDYLRSLKARRIPWTITKEDLRKPEAELIEVVRSGIWDDPSGANPESRQMVDKRARHDAQQEAKRRKIENGEEVKAPVYATQFSQEDIESEQRRPKKKVAVLLGYSGTGYKGMQLSETEKTIEGELFAAFVAAGAISKANATDPKKSSLVRCARTDKGVHAAGNIVSLKLIVEDEDIIQKINEKLSSQIRVWDILVTNKSFSSYQLCDSRIYEYLIPTHCFLPPHPSTYLGKKLVEYAEKEGDMEGYKARQEEVASYWDETDEKYVRPILENTPEDIRKLVEKVLHLNDEDQSAQDEMFQTQDKPATEEATTSTEQPSASEEKPADAEKDEAEEARRRQIFETVKAVKAAYLQAKKAYRIPAQRLARVQEALDKYVGTNNFFNYTIQKTHADPSSKRHIKSFKMADQPIIINGTEWLSLKVHGQSFMMHQIRKMVAMAAMVVRCGCDPQRIVDTYGPNKIAIPKAPGLGLLLERPVFDSYNRKTHETGKDPIDFDKHADTINEFKQREIYDRIFREEEETHAFSAFFGHLDHYSQEEFLYVTSGGIPAARLVSVPANGTEDKKSQREALAEVEGGASEDEGAPPNGGEEGG